MAEDEKDVLSISMDIGFMTALAQAVHESFVEIQNRKADHVERVGVRPGYLLDALWVLQFHNEREVADHYRGKIKKALGLTDEAGVKDELDSLYNSLNEKQEGGSDDNDARSV